MGDRNNPIKFGPEWLRNLAREGSVGSPSMAVGQSAAEPSGPSGSATIPSGGGGAAASNTGAASNTANSNGPPKIQLAKLRYGREEMLALYDRNAEAPPELKYIDVLYQPRGKPPFALNNSFEEEMREGMRSGPNLSATSGERFGTGRGLGRGLSVSEGRGRPRMPFVRQPIGRTVQRHAHAGSPRMSGFSGGADEDAQPLVRSWSNSASNTPTRNPGGEQTEWPASKMFRSKRQGNNTNWRQSQSRDDGEEWRSMEATGSRQDKWERDWSDRPNQDKSQSWSSNRRTWVAGDSQNDDNLPEWATDAAEACGGTFDSSGAFHGYSNDDTNLPKNQESPSYPLVRSQTHGSFVRSKTVEEGSDEWWASEKAKKLSPKRFDASDIKFKKSLSSETSEVGNPGAKSNPKDDMLPDSMNERDKSEKESLEISIDSEEYNKNAIFQSKLNESFDALLEDGNNERGNFHSVMIPPNNSLRQKHQNIVSPVNDSAIHQNRQSSGILQLLHSTPNTTRTNEVSKQLQSAEEKLVEQIFDITLEEKYNLSKFPISSGNSMNMGSGGVSTGMSPSAISMAPMPNPNLPMGLANSSIANNAKPNLPTSGVQGGNLQLSSLSLSLSNALGLSPLRPSNTPIGIPIQAGTQVMSNPGIVNPGLNAPTMQQSSGMPGFPSNGMPVMPPSNVGSASMFLGPNSTPMPPANDIPMPSHGVPVQSNMFPMHGLQHSTSQTGFPSAAMFGNVMQQPPPQPTSNLQNMAEQWYYEDPKKIVQGPFSSKEMYTWYTAGFFSPSLMVRRACESVMRPLGSYGPVVPFACGPMDMIPPFPLSSNFDSHKQVPSETMLNPQHGIGLDVVNIPNMNKPHNNPNESLQFGTVGIMRNPPFVQQPMMDSLWSQPAPSPGMIWMQQPMNARNETRINNLPMFFWNQQQSNSLMTEEIAKEMKTEDQILAQVRAAQNLEIPPPPFVNEQAIPMPPGKHDEHYSNMNMTPNLEELQKLIQKDTLQNTSMDSNHDVSVVQNKSDKVKVDATQDNKAVQPQAQNKVSDNKPSKQSKNEVDKSSKSKEVTTTKNKSKKSKEDKKDEVDNKSRDDDNKAEHKRSQEQSPTKGKKDEKQNRKGTEKDKQELLKEGFTIVKGAEKNNNNKDKRKEDAKAAEEAERKRKEEEKMIAEEERKRRQSEAIRKQQEQMQQQQQRQASESVLKKAPWSAVATQAMQAPSKEGITLAEIQRLEREKKLEQMKEQQQMMQIIAQQQAVAIAREHEMQSSLGWAKKKGNISNISGPSLAEIQAETKKQALASAAAAAAAQALEEANMLPPAPPSAPWGNPQNGGPFGFWETQGGNPAAVQKQPDKQPEVPKAAVEPKNKKKAPVIIPQKKESSPALEFESWCNTILTSWSSKIDVPTFIGFLKDIESPYEVKDYVKCYLGESKESNDFSRQFLERRSKLLRVGMVTPSDDLCSPAIAINPRTISGSDYQEKNNKKTKKNKMLKVDARILGFSVTASEDRINVGDIDTA